MKILNIHFTKKGALSFVNLGREEQIDFVARNAKIGRKSAENYLKNIPYGVSKAEINEVQATHQRETGADGGGDSNTKARKASKKR